MYSKTELLKNVYADVILMNMKDNDYSLNEEIVNELLMYASLDTLMYYGTETLSYEFNNKCMEEFWRRAIEIENKVELKRKYDLDKKLILSLKKKGDRNGIEHGVACGVFCNYDRRRPLLQKKLNRC